MATPKRVRTYGPKHSDKSLSREWRINMANKKKKYLGEQKHWSATVQNLNNKSPLTMDKIAPIVRFIERLGTHLKDRFPEENKLCNWCTVYLTTAA